MTANDLLVKLWALGIKLTTSEGQLNLRVPKGAMTAELHAELKTHKESIIKLLARPIYQRGVPCEHCGENRWRYEPLAYDQGGHVCKNCYRAVKA